MFWSSNLIGGIEVVSSMHAVEWPCSIILYIAILNCIVYTCVLVLNKVMLGGTACLYFKKVPHGFGHRF